MPAGIAVNVSHAKLNTQEKNAPLSADKKSSVKKSTDAAREKVSESDFKKLLDGKTEENGKKKVSSNAEKNNSVEIRKKAYSGIRKPADKLKSDPEKQAEKQIDENVSEELKAENIISFNAEFKKQKISDAEKSPEKNSFSCFNVSRF